jgi:hypothetical protein
LDEASAGDSEAAGRRLEALRGMPLLDVSSEEPPVICTPLELVEE